MIASGYVHPVDTDNGLMLVFPMLTPAVDEFPVGHHPRRLLAFSGLAALAVAVVTVALANTHGIRLDGIYRHAAAFTGLGAEFGFSVESSATVNRLTVWCAPTMDGPAQATVARLCW
jgi:hypothetical protein